MAKIRHLRKAPIVEAVVDFRVVLPSDFNPEKLREAREYLKAKYPGFAETKRFTARLELAVGRAPSHQTEDLGLLGVVAKSSDGLTIAQLGVDGFTMNRLKPYTSWKKIGPEALRLWRYYSELTKPEAITRIGLRYINHIAPLPDSGRLEHFVLTPPPGVPRNIPRHVGSFRVRTVVEDPKKGIAATITQVFGPSAEVPGPTTDAPGYALLLDIDAYKIEKLAMGADFRKILEDLHTYKNQIFFGTLTERVVKRFEK